MKTTQTLSRSLSLSVLLKISLGVMLHVHAVHGQAPLSSRIAKTGAPSQLKKNNTLDIIAVVGDKAITERDLESRVKLILVTSGIAVNESNAQLLREQVLKNIIEEMVQLATAEQHKVVASDSDVTDALKRIAESAHTTPKEMEAKLKKQGVPFHYLKDRVKAQLSWMNFVQGASMHHVHIADSEIESAFNAAKKNDDHDQFEVYEIFLRADDPSHMANVKRQAESLITKLKNGGNFNVIAQQFSNSPSASKGGYVGWVPTHNGKDTSAYEKLEVGQISQPVETSHGVYIYLLSNKKKAGHAATADTLVSFNQIYVPLTAGFKPEDDPFVAAHLENLMTAPSHKVMNIAKERGLKIDVVRDRSMSDLNPELQKFLNSLPLHKLSAPSLAPDGLVMIFVTNKRKGEPPKPLTREDIKAKLENDRLGRAAAQHMNQAIAKTHIDIKEPNVFPNLVYARRST